MEVYVAAVFKGLFRIYMVKVLVQSLHEPFFPRVRVLAELLKFTKIMTFSKIGKIRHKNI